MKGGGRAPPPPPPTKAWAYFTLLIECTPESSRCYSVYSVEDLQLTAVILKHFHEELIIQNKTLVCDG